jgi:hypothetical protein
MPIKIIRSLKESDSRNVFVLSDGTRFHAGESNQVPINKKREIIQRYRHPANSACPLSSQMRDTDLRSLPLHKYEQIGRGR